MEMNRGSAALCRYYSSFYSKAAAGDHLWKALQCEDEFALRRLQTSVNILLGQSVQSV